MEPINVFVICNVVVATALVVYMTMAFLAIKKEPKPQKHKCNCKKVQAAQPKDVEPVKDINGDTVVIRRYSTYHDFKLDILRHVETGYEVLHFSQFDGEYITIFKPVLRIITTPIESHEDLTLSNVLNIDGQCIMSAKDRYGNHEENIKEGCMFTVSGVANKVFTIVQHCDPISYMVTPKIPGSVKEGAKITFPDTFVGVPGEWMAHEKKIQKHKDKYGWKGPKEG